MEIETMNTTNSAESKRYLNNRGGARLGAGRKRNLLAVQARYGQDGKPLPLDILMQTMNERWEAAQAASDPEQRAKYQDEACAVAEKIAPYMHPRLAATTLKGDDQNPLNLDLGFLTADALKALVRGIE